MSNNVITPFIFVIRLVFFVKFKIPYTKILSRKTKIGPLRFALKAKIFCFFNLKNQNRKDERKKHFADSMRDIQFTKKLVRFSYPQNYMLVANFKQKFFPKIFPSAWAIYKVLDLRNFSGHIILKNLQKSIKISRCILGLSGVHTQIEEEFIMRPDSICALNITRWYIMVHHHVIRTQSICCAIIGRCRMQRAGYKLRIFLHFFFFKLGKSEFLGRFENRGKHKYWVQFLL